jgi:hypothetical protein
MRMTYNDRIMNELKHAIEVWRMNYLIEKGIDPQPNIASVVGKIEVTLDPVEVNSFDRGEEE